MNIKAGKDARISIVESIELIKIIKKNPNKTYGQLSTEMRVSESTVKRIFKRLEYAGVIIENTGSRRIPFYEIRSLGVFSEDMIMENSQDTDAMEVAEKSETGEFNDA